MSDPICRCGVAQSEHDLCGCADGFEPQTTTKDVPFHRVTRSNVTAMLDESFLQIARSLRAREVYQFEDPDEDGREYTLLRSEDYALMVESLGLVKMVRERG